MSIRKPPPTLAEAIKVLQREREALIEELRRLYQEEAKVEQSQPPRSSEE